MTMKIFSTMSSEYKKSWKCFECQSQLPKSDNSNTPIRMQNRTNIMTSDDDNVREVENITMRPKNKPSSVNEEGLRNMIKQEMTSTIQKLVSEQLANISQQITGFHESLTFLSKQYDDLLQSVNEKNKIIAGLVTKNEGLSQQVKTLTEKVNNIEQIMRSPNLEINGIPEHHSENLVKTIEQLGRIIESPIEDKDILHVTRIAKHNKNSDRPRSVIVKLSSQRRRDEILAAVMKFNKKNVDKLNSEHLGIGGCKIPVFVSEHLTPSNKHLHAAARLKTKEAGFKFIWVRDGRIFARKNEQSKVLFIRDEDSLKLIV
ncbi:uncharacterized protein LOC121729227 [Aricia agestis]|uniref:uncharacterized protein LOC121729227 n=1 Tax=Aricia agestis TaxID=91739 RepID=UPI001C205E7E|nr:uncharacterized protein LOC121729227 [Aricia agestis]